MADYKCAGCGREIHNYTDDWSCRVCGCITAEKARAPKESAMTTSTVELLPLPDDGPYYDPGDMQEYARACVAHATAAKDAEIEALRVRADAMAGEAIKHEARAERLAEALQWYAEQAEGCRKIGSIGEPFRKELDRDGGKRARAALRDHDQEGGNP